MTDIEKVARAIVERLIAAIEFECPPIRDGVGVGRRTAILEQLAHDARAELAAMQPAPQWKWIGSAPRNGTCVLLWIPAEDGWPAYIASGWYESGVFDNRWYAASDENPLSPQPTHWMPLPTPPAGGSDAE